MTRSHVLSLRALLPAALFLAAGVVVGVGCGGGGGGGGGSNDDGGGGGGGAQPVNTNPLVTNVTAYATVTGTPEVTPSRLINRTATSTQPPTGNSRTITIAAATNNSAQPGDPSLRVVVPAARFVTGASFPLGADGATATYTQTVDNFNKIYTGTSGTIRVTKAGFDNDGVGRVTFTFDNFKFVKPADDTAASSFTMTVVTTLPLTVSSNAQGVVRDVNGLRLVNATVAYYNSSSNVPLKTAKTSASGLLPTVPSGATRFSVDARGATSKNITTGATSTASYYPRYDYDGGVFDATTKCLAALPTAGSNRGFTADVVYTPIDGFSAPPGPGGDACVGPTG